MENSKKPTKWKKEISKKESEKIEKKNIEDLLIFDYDIKSLLLGQESMRKKMKENESPIYYNSLEKLSPLLSKPSPKDILTRKVEPKNLEFIFNENKEINSWKFIPEKSKEKYLQLNNYIPNFLNIPFKSLSLSPLGLNVSLDDSATITASNIGEYALPIVEYIHQLRPDYIVASDRGARLLGLAVFRLYSQLHGRLPTSDGTLRFRRFSKSNSTKDTENHLKPLVKEMLKFKKKPTVLVLDDWVVSGGTKKLAQETFDKLGKGKIKVKFGVLTGNGADVSRNDGHSSGFAGVTDWRDDSNIIGITYSKNDYANSGIRGYAVRSAQAFDYRRRMYAGINELARKIIKERSLSKV
ncbi:MAG: phosphoribosyltransferase [Nanoarchaeota archaeon]|nr:phosphoribosyltransferase [Nanoarchaeota archaeon]